MKLFKMGKRYKNKDLMWYMVGEMVKKQGKVAYFMKLFLPIIKHFSMLEAKS